MNDYKVNYKAWDQDDDSYDIVTELTEDKARKFFKARHKGESIEIKSVELIRENTTATKDQEREVLTAIKKMVADLGPDSYLRTAFAGCFADAEQNIEDDAAYSMKGRLEYAEGQLAEAQQEIKRLKEKLAESEKDYEAAHAAAHAIAEQKDAEIAALRGRIPQADDIHDAVQLMGEKVYSLKEQEEAAKKIVETADAPESPEFRQAVTDHRNAKSSMDYYTEVMKRLAGSQQ